MPRLPGPEALGGLPSMRSGRAPAQVSGKDPIAAGIGAVGSAMVGIATEQRKEDDSLDLIKADAHLNQGLTELNRQFETDPDHATYGDRFTEGAAKVRTEAEGMIRNPRIREKWLPRADTSIVSTRDRVLGRGTALAREERFDEIDGILTGQRETYLTAPDDETRERTRTTMAETIELGRRSGLLQPNRARELQRKHIVGAIEDDVRNQIWNDPYATLRDLSEGDRRARADSTGAISDQGLAAIRRTLPDASGLTPTQRTAADRRIREETSGLSAYLNDNATGLTQLQHDALVSFGHRKGQGALEALLPDIQAGNWTGVAAGMRGVTHPDTPVPGRLESGNIDLNARPVVRNQDGSISTVRSMSVNFDGKEVLIPTVSEDGRILTEQQAIAQYRETGRHLGMFDTPENATAYAKRLHEDQERQYARPENMPGFRAQAGKGPSALSVAQRFVGKNEREHADVLAEFFKRAGGQNLNPAQTAWCMAFVNAAIGDSGAGGTGTLMARDALRIGTPTRDPREGDIVVMDRGPDPSKGHVGFYMGRNPDGSIRVLGGNQGGNQGGNGRVSVESFDQNRVLGYRTPPKAGTQVPGVNPDAAGDRLTAIENDRSAQEAEMVLGRAPSPRYAALPPDRRRALVTQAQTALRAVTQQEMGDELERIRRTGEMERGAAGMTALDRARRVLTPNQLAKAEIAIDEAQRTFQATAGLSDLTENEAAEHLNGLAPSQQSPDESYRTSVRVQTKATKAWDKIADLRQKDPAQAVSGGVIRGSGARSQVTVGPNGELTVVPGGDDDVRNQPAPEVASAVELLRRRRPGVSLTQGEDGSIEVQTEQGQEVSGQAAWKAIIEARVAAQTRLGIPDWQRRVITRAEGQRLLDMPPDAGMNDREFTRRLRAAADRAEQIYGSQYARQALEAALSFRTTANERREEANSIIARTARGERVTSQDIERLNALENVDRIGRLWEGQGGLDPNYGQPERPAIFPRNDIVGEVNAIQGREAQRQFTQAQPNDAQRQWLLQNIEQRSQAFDAEFGQGAAARAVYETQRKQR